MKNKCAASSFHVFLLKTNKEHLAFIKRMTSILYFYSTGPTPLLPCEVGTDQSVSARQPLFAKEKCRLLYWFVRRCWFFLGEIGQIFMLHYKFPHHKKFSVVTCSLEDGKLSANIAQLLSKS